MYKFFSINKKHSNNFLKAKTMFPKLCRLRFCIKYLKLNWYHYFETYNTSNFLKDTF